MKTFDDLLANGPCQLGKEFAFSFSTLSEAWDNCKRPDWLLWFLGRIKGTHNTSAQFAKECAERAKRFCNAAYAAANAAAYAAANAAANAAYAAAYAAYAAADAAYAAANAAANAANVEKEWQCNRIREIFSDFRP